MTTRMNLSVIVITLLTGCGAPEQKYVDSNPNGQAVYTRTNRTPFGAELNCLSNLYASSGQSIAVAVGNIPNNHSITSDAASLAPADARYFAITALRHLPRSVTIIDGENQKANFTITGAITEVAKEEKGMVDLNFNGLGGGSSYELMKVAVDITVKHGDMVVETYPIENHIRYKADINANVFFIYGSTFSEFNANKHVESPVAYGIREAVEAGISYFIRDLLFAQSHQIANAGCPSRATMHSNEDVINRVVEIADEPFNKSKRMVRFQLKGSSLLDPVTIKCVYYAESTTESLGHCLPQLVSGVVGNPNNGVTLSNVPFKARYIEVLVNDKNDYKLATKTISLQ